MHEQKVSPFNYLLHLGICLGIAILLPTLTFYGGELFGLGMGYEGTLLHNILGLVFIALGLLWPVGSVGGGLILGGLLMVRGRVGDYHTFFMFFAFVLLVVLGSIEVRRMLKIGRK